jgi:hypothetical protein
MARSGYPGCFGKDLDAIAAENPKIPRIDRIKKDTSVCNVE